AVAVSIQAVSPELRVGAVSCAATSCANARAGIPTAAMTAATAADMNLQCVIVRFSSADANRLFDVEHEDLAVADLAGRSGSLDRFHRVLHEPVGHCDFDAHFRQEADLVF